jgi:uncharacterized membrane protein
MRNSVRAGLATLLLVAVGFVPSASAASCVHTAYTVAELPGLGGPVTQVAGIAENGDAAGRSLDASWATRAVRWSGGQVTALSNSSSAAYGISSSAKIAGQVIGQRGAVATLWSPATTLKSPRGSIGALASDVNASSLAVGWWTNSNGDTFAIRWDGTRATSLVGGSGAPSISLAIAVNDAGTIVGRGDFETAPFRRALKWVGTTMTALPGLGSGYDAATAISASGLITGAGLSPVDSKYHAVVWNGTTVTDLGLFGSAPTAAYGINSCGTVVGDAVISVVDDVTEAIIWQGGAAAVALESLLPPNHGWDMHTAVGINEAGQIVGYGYRSGMSGLRSFVMTPA